MFPHDNDSDLAYLIMTIALFRKAFLSFLN